jgi:arylsulfatase A-like enzyme
MDNNIKNVILISVDSLRYDAISCEPDKRRLMRYGVDDLVDTPNIDWFAANGVRFSQCISTSSYTPAAHASMLTGLHSSRHGIKTFFGKLSSRVNTLSEILSHNGFSCLSRIEHPALKSLDITRGISLIDEPGKNGNENLFSLLSRCQNKNKKFIFIHLFDVHKPYCYPLKIEQGPDNKAYLELIGKIAERTKVDLQFLIKTARKESKRKLANCQAASAYARDLAFATSLDFAFRDCLRRKEMLIQELVPLYIKGVVRFDKGKFHNLIGHLRSSGLLRDCLLIITADHGEARRLWDGSEDFMNGFELCEPLIRVPLILYSPDALPKGKVIDTQVSLVDIVPTILDILKIDCPNINFHGKNRFPLIRGEQTCADNLAYSEAWVYDQQGVNAFGQKKEKIEFFRRQRSIRTPTLKYIETGESLAEADFSVASTHDFIKAAYRKILGRFENNFELLYWADALKRRRISRAQLSERLVASMERLKLRQMLFDLSCDPFEENNLSSDFNSRASISNFKQEMSLYNCDREEALSGLSQEEEALKANLANLGYF